MGKLGSFRNTGVLYPKVIVDVSYYIIGSKTKIQYPRIVAFLKVYDTKVFADINVDLKDIESFLKATAKATIRTANHLDRNRGTVFDKLDVLAAKSLQNDLLSATGVSRKRQLKTEQQLL